MRLAAIVDHRGRSTTAIETSVFFVDSENIAVWNQMHDFTASSCQDSHFFLVSRVPLTITPSQTYTHPFVTTLNGLLDD